MAFYRCASCGKRPSGRTASIYWAVFNGDSSRDAFKQRLCRSCWNDLDESWLGAALAIDNAEVASDKCASCSRAQADDGCTLFATLYVPKQEPIALVAELCRACFAKRVADAHKGAIPLLDRGMSGPVRAGDDWD